MQSYSSTKVGRAVLEEGNEEAVVGKRLRTPEEEEVRDMDLRKHSPAVGTEPKAKHSDSSDTTGPNLPGRKELQD